MMKRLVINGMPLGNGTAMIECSECGVLGEIISEEELKAEMFRHFSVDHWQGAPV